MKSDELHPHPNPSRDRGRYELSQRHREWQRFFSCLKMERIGMLFKCVMKWILYSWRPLRTIPV